MSTRDDRCGCFRGGVELLGEDVAVELGGEVRAGVAKPLGDDLHLDAGGEAHSGGAMAEVVGAP